MLRDTVRVLLNASNIEHDRCQYKKKCWSGNNISTIVFAAKALGDFQGPYGFLGRASGKHLEGSWRHLDASGKLWVASGWSPKGSRTHLGSIRRHLQASGRPLEPLETICKQLEASRRHRMHLGTSGRHLETPSPAERHGHRLSFD